MKTTLVIDEGVMRRLKQEAHSKPPLPSLDAGAPYVDLADRDSLYDAMEKRQCS